MATSLILGHQETQKVMGVSATITVHATNASQLIDQGFQQLAQFEQLWSRFLPHSDITRLNNASGSPVVVHPDTVALIATMKTAHRESLGRFNPTLLPLHRQNSDMNSLTSQDICVLPSTCHPWTTLDDITFTSPTTVTLPAGMSLDAGGIAKGFAADHVVDSLINNGALSVSVNIGGDITVRSVDGHCHDWNFDICDISHSHTWSTVSLRNGALATSSQNARHRNNGPAQHIYSSDNFSSQIAVCSVICSQATWAEAWTKYVFFAPDPIAAIESKQLAALFVDQQGNIFRSTQWKEFEL